MRRLPRVPPIALDGLLAVSIAAAGCVFGNQYHPPGWRTFDLLGYGLTCLISLPLAARRRYPVLVLLVCDAAFAAYIGAGYQPSLNFWSPIIALFFVAASRTREPVLICWAITGAGILHSGLVAQLTLPVAAAQALLVPPIAVAVGATTRRLAQRNALLAAMTARLHAEQRERARQAVIEERVRIARELHDVIAHHMSVISIQAGVAKYVLTSDPHTAQAALATVGDTSREALAELRRMLALLRVGPDDLDDDARVDGAAHDPAPGLDRLDALIERVCAAGVPVELVVVGERRPLAPGADLCVYRVIQEGLTNVLTHAAPARASVTLAYTERDLTVRITDDGRRPRTPIDLLQPRRSGHGLAGMRERARIYGGTLTAGHRAECGFEVVLTLPAAALARSEPAAETVAASGS